MNCQTADLRTAFERIEKLETENLWLRRSGIVAVIAVAAVIIMGQAGTSRTIETEKVVILDSHGRPRVTIGTPQIAGAAVGLRPDAPAIWLSDENGTDRAILTTDGLRIGDGRGKPLVELGGEPSRSALRFYGPDGKVSWSSTP